MIWRKSYVWKADGRFPWRATALLNRNNPDSRYIASFATWADAIAWALEPEIAW